jgi:hydroxyacylglutathione hydrolase
MPLQIFTIKAGINRCYLVKDKGAILIDSGPPRKARIFQKAFHKLSIKPDEIKLIILTHGDLDHSGSAKDIRKFTGARIAIHYHDKLKFEQSLHNFPQGVNSWGRLQHFILDPILRKILTGGPPGDADIVLDDNDYPLTDFGISGKIIFTPGHTKGSVSVLLDTGEAFVGCMAHNNLPFRLKPGLPIFAEDIDRVKASWKSIIDQGASTIYPGHGDPFSVEIIKGILEK